VSDFAGVLDQASKAELTAIAEDAERSSSAQLAIVTVASLDGLTVEEYANKLFNAWGVGQKGKNNGVLLLIAPAERKVRIEVGYGLEAVLPDGACGEIIRRDLVPEFKAGRAGAGAVAAARRIAAIAKGDERAPREAAPLRKGDPRGWLFALCMAFLLGRGLRAREVTPFVGGAVGWAVSLLFVTMAMAAVAGMVGLVAGLVISLPVVTNRRGGGVWGGGGSWGGGGFGGGGGGGFGGFSGGSSGGGGASGGW
jgi:uncharacterized protein